MMTASLILTAAILQANPWVTPRAEGPGVTQVVYDSRLAKASVSFHVWLPEGVKEGQNEKLPVLYWLHGSGGGQAGIAPLALLFSRAVSRGAIPKIILVFPNGLPNGMWTDSVNERTPVESILIKEIIPEVEKRFPASVSRSARMIDGFSMGGYGAGRLGFKHPDLFCAVSMLGAGPLQNDLLEAPERTRINPAARQRILDEVYGGSSKTFYDHSPSRYAKELATSKKERPMVRVAIGEKDFTLPANRDFHKFLEKLGIKHSFTTVPDVGHEPLALIRSMGDDFWAFYREALKKNTGVTG